ncbi:response regulator [candidate division KSB1 bacterium]|nr:response regulator [candidate division KSB1 bacterium]
MLRFNRLKAGETRLKPKGKKVKTERTHEKKVLLLGDEFLQNEALVRLLHTGDYQVIVHPNATSTSEFKTADLIVLELEQSLHGMNDLLRIKTQVPGVKIIVVSSGATDVAVKAFYYGATDFFTKPLDITLLSERISALLTQN